MSLPTVAPDQNIGAVSSQTAPSSVEWVIPGRTQIAGPESVFINSAISSFQHSLSCAPVILREPSLPTGFPDVIAVYFRRPTIDLYSFRLALTARHFQLLHYLYERKSATVAAVAADLLWSHSAVEQAYLDLNTAGLVRRNRGHITCASISTVFWARRIVAIEAKVRNCNDAIQQAVANSWYASHSFVLIPEEKWRSQLERHAMSHGVGVMLFDGARIRMALAPIPRPLPSSYGSWLVHEYALRQRRKSNEHD